MSLLVNETMANGSSSFFLREGVPINGNTVFTGDVSVDGELTVGQQLTMEGGALISGGNLTLGGGGAVLTVVSGPVNARSSFIRDNIHAGTMDVSGAVLIGGNVRAATASVVGNVHAGTMDISGDVLIAGKPVARSVLVPFTGASGSTITVPIGTTAITGNFSVIANHSYRVSLNCRPISGDTNPGNFVSFIADLSYNFIGMGGISSGPAYDFPGGRAFVGVLKALSSGNCRVQCINSTIGSTILELYPTGTPPPYNINPGVLVEDLGIL